MEEQRKEKNSSKKVTELETKHTRYKIPTHESVPGFGILAHNNLQHKNMYSVFSIYIKIHFKSLKPGALNTVAGEGVLQEDRFVFLRKQVTHLFSPREKIVYGYAIYSTECQLLCHLFFLLPR